MLYLVENAENRGEADMCLFMLATLFVTDPRSNIYNGCSLNAGNLGLTLVISNPQVHYL